MNLEPSQTALSARRLSPERLGPYVVAAAGDVSAAINIYVWNAEISAALATTIGHVEIVLRNAIHENLTAWSTRQSAEPRWYLGTPVTSCSRARRMTSVSHGDERSRVATGSRRPAGSSRNSVLVSGGTYSPTTTTELITALELVGWWICPVSQAWIQRHSRTTEVLGRQPS